MQDINVKTLHEMLGGQLRLGVAPPPTGENAAVTRVVTDSRNVAPGDLFWALPGTRYHGAAFAEDAYRRGAKGVVADCCVQPPAECWSIEVRDSLEALTTFARWNRCRFHGALVAVTGSVGKTTARQMIHSVLSVKYTGTASPNNFNNHVGVPLSLLGIEPEHRFAVVELGASAPGEILSLAELCGPQVGVITRIAESHLGGFGNAQSLAEAKTDLLTQLPSDGWSVLTGDDPWLRRLACRSRAKVVWIGRSADCHVVATNIVSRAGRLTFRVDNHPFQVAVWGRHHLTSALAAIAVGKIFGLSLTEIAAGLAGFEPPPMRCEVTEMGGAVLINDAYNASPTSMRAALELLRDFDAPGRRIVVCGDMRELGEPSGQLHRRLGDEVVTLCGADVLVACGEHAEDVVAGARSAGMPRTRTIACRKPEESLPYLNRSVGPGDVVLVKGSRGMAMERLASALGQNLLARAA